MRKGVSFLLWMFICMSAGAQTTVFSDNFNASTGAAYTAAAGPIGSSTTWSLSRSGIDWGGKIDVGVMDLSNDVSASGNVNGWAFGYTPTASFTAPYTTTLNANTSTVTWYFNMRQIRANPAGFSTGSYGVAFVLGGSSTAANTTGNGYAVVLGNTTAVDPVRLVKYTGGLSTLSTTSPPTANDLIVSNTAGLTTFGTEYLSIKVTYAPSTNTWELFLRNDGSSAFTDPTTGSLVSQGTAVDATYTGVALDYLGGYWQGSTGATQTAFFDNVNVTVGLPPANTITTGVVTGAAFSLGNCAATASGTVAFTSTDVFAGGNIFTAQLSDDIGSFVSPTNIGTLALSGTAPAGIINITIPAGTVSGTGYLIRVVSSNPTITGSSSAAFTITQTGLCASSHTDYYRSFQTGDWVDNTTWESSPDNVSWIAATLAPTFNANTITIRNTHTVTIISSSSADQLTIDAGGTLVQSNGQAFSLNNGTGTDMTVNGTYVLNGTQPSGTGTIEIPSGGLVRVDGNAAPGESDDFAFGNANVTFRTGCTYEWASTLFTPSWTARTFFTIGENTRYLFSQTPSFALGGANPTVIYGTLEATAPITFTGAGTKTIANGILGSASIDASGSTGNIIITGSATSVLGGAGLLTLPPSPSYLMVGGSTVLSMTSSKQVTGIINFANFGYIQLGAFDLTVNGSLTGGNTIAHVISDGAGFLKILAIGAGPVVFPIGADIATYNPVTIRSGGAADYSARVEVGLNPAIFNNNFAVLRTWNLKSSATVAGVDIDLEYNGSQGGPSFNYAGPVEVGAFIGASWNIIATGLTPTGSYLVNVNPVNVLTAGVSVPIVIGNLGSILPVDCIVGCRSQKVNNKGIISWDVNTCAEVTSFEIQRSVNRGAFTTIGTVSPSLNSTTFNYTDDALASGTNLYRIKVNRVTGGSKFSNTVAIINGGGDLFISQVSPNPAHDQAWITISAGKKSSASFTIYNQSGQPVKQWQSSLTDGSNRISLDMLNLPAGNYTLSAVSGENRTVYRFVKQ